MFNSVLQIAQTSSGSIVTSSPVVGQPCKLIASKPPGGGQVPQQQPVAPQLGGKTTVMQRQPLLIGQLGESFMHENSMQYALYETTCSS